MRSSSEKDWSTRIAEGAAEKEAVEEVEYGVKIKFLICDFFVSEDVIPDECKIYEDGVLYFNLKGIDFSDLIVKEIFRRRCFDIEDAETDISAIKIRMYALLNILKFDISHSSELEIRIYKSALLGAMGSLITALDENAVFCNVLNTQFKSKLRNATFHWDRVLDGVAEGILRTLFLHMYEHCRCELASHHHFPSLADLIKENEKFESEFKWIVEKCINTHSVFYEWKESVLEKLAKQKSTLSEIIAYCNNDPTSHSKGEYKRKTAIAIRGNAIGLYIARLSAGAMSLLKGRAHQLAKKKEEGIGIEASSLTQEEKKKVQQAYGRFIRHGCAFRHNELNYTELPKLFHVKIAIPRKPTHRNKPRHQRVINKQGKAISNSHHSQRNSLVQPSTTPVSFFNRPGPGCYASKHTDTQVTENKHTPVPKQKMIEYKRK